MSDKYLDFELISGTELPKPAPPTLEDSRRAAGAKRLILEAHKAYGRRFKELYEDALFMLPEDFDKKWPPG